MRIAMSAFAVLSLLSIILQNAPASGAQSTITFEVASVRANTSGSLSGFRGTKGRTYVATNQRLRNLIAQAYDLPAERIFGGPAWIGNNSSDVRFVTGDRFDITATLPEGSTVQQVPFMLRALLADRFRLVTHSEKRDMPIYAMVTAQRDGQLGPQLRKASIDCQAAEAAGEVIPPPKPGEPVRCQREVGGEILGRGQRMDELARILSRFADRPVMNRTGLAGGYDFDLRFPTLNTPAEARSDVLGNDVGGGIFVAVQEQLGLRLQPSTAPLDVLVIDHIERPAEN